MKFIISILLITSSIFAYGQVAKTKFCSPTIEALESKGDIKIINNCGIDEKQIKLEFEKFREMHRIGNKDIQFSFRKVTQLFNDYQKISNEKLEIIQQGVADSNVKIDKLIDSQNYINQRNIKIDVNTLQEVVNIRNHNDFELILDFIPSLSPIDGSTTLSSLIHKSEVYLNCKDLIKVLQELNKHNSVASFYGGDFILSIIDRVTPPYHQTCYSDVGTFLSIIDRDDVILKLHEQRAKLLRK